jgi:DNA-directed RNA polymerase subunit RPC12/RpoP
MPIRRYACPDCHKEQRRFESGQDDELVKCACGALMFRTLGAPQPRAMTMADEYHGKSIQLDVSKQLLERAREHEAKEKKHEG